MDAYFWDKITSNLYLYWANIWLLEVLSLKEVSKQTPGCAGGTGNCVTNCKQDFMMWPFSLLVCTTISFSLNTPLLKSHELWYVFCLVISRYFLCEFYFYPLVIWCCAVWISSCLWASNFFPYFWLYPIAIEGLNFFLYLPQHTSPPEEGGPEKCIVFH